MGVVARCVERRALTWLMLAEPTDIGQSLSHAEHFCLADTDPDSHSGDDTAGSARTGRSAAMSSPKVSQSKTAATNLPAFGMPLPLGDDLSG